LQIATSKRISFASGREGGAVRPVRAVAAESLALKHQLLISNRSHRRAPNLTTLDRIVLALTTLFVSPHRIRKLGAVITADKARVSELDALVNGRVQRRETAATLLAANDLFERGHVEEAERRLATQQKALASAAVEARRAAPRARKDAVDKDFEGQASSLSNASSGFNKKAPAVVGQRALRSNQAAANPFMD